MLSRATPQVVETLIPRRRPGPPAVDVGIDLVPGWDGPLAINGVEIPEDELVDPADRAHHVHARRRQDGRAVRDRPELRDAVIWRIEDGRGISDRTIPWCFEVV